MPFYASLLVMSIKVLIIDNYNVSLQPPVLTPLLAKASAKDLGNYLIKAD